MSNNKFRSLMMLEVMSAASLQDADGIGKSDPYVIVKFDSDEAVPRELRTHVIDNTLHPVWNQKMYFLVADDCKSFHVQVKDQDVIKDSKLGHCTILRRDADSRHRRYEEDFYLEDGEGATIKLAIHEIDISNGLEHVVDERKHAVDDAIRGAAQPQVLLQVKIHGAEGLKSGIVDKSDPYAKFKFEDNSVAPQGLRTQTIDNNPSPVWNCMFHFLVPRGLANFQIEVMDEDVASDDSLGHSTLIMGRLGERKSDKYAISKKGQLRVSYFTVPLNGLFD
jgi:Ca2+-dependent lipid-binding protein